MTSTTPPLRHQDLSHEVNSITGDVVDAALSVHSALGPGLLERVYKVCLAHELQERGRNVEVEVPAPVVYDGIHLEVGYRLDLLVDRTVVVEVKAVEGLHGIHFSQVATYLKLTDAPVGLLINFHEPWLRRGIRRILPPRRREGGQDAS